MEESGMREIDTLIGHLKDGVPWALARFNDGEHRCIFSEKGGKVSRGKQEIIEDLKVELMQALAHRQKNYWIGLPCGKCFPGYRKKQLVAYPDLKDYTWITHAVVLSNRNRRYFVESFPRLVKGKKVMWIGGSDQDIKKLPFEVSSSIQVPPTNAFRFGFAEVMLRTAEPEEGTIVLTSCGPLGRVIAHRWFHRRPDLTIIDVGSTWDPETIGTKSARIHQGKLKACAECH